MAENINISVDSQNENITIGVKDTSTAVDVESARINENVAQSVGGDKYYTDLAKEWAISPYKVQNVDYSSKYYAQLAREYSLTAKTGAEWLTFSVDDWVEAGNGKYKVVFDGVIAVMSVFKVENGNKALVNTDMVITTMDTTIYNYKPFDGFLLCSKSIIESADYTPATVDTLMAMLEIDIIDITGD